MRGQGPGVRGLGPGARGQRAFAVLLVLLLLAPAARASTPWGIIGGTVARLWHGTTQFPGAAVRNWRVTVPVVAVAGALILFGDTRISDQIQSPGLERASRNWSNRGLLVIEPAFALTTAAIEDHCLFCPSTGKFALTAITTEGYATAVVQVLKYSAGRERPFTAGDGDGGFNEGGTSFPSGHAIGAFSLAALLAQHDPQATWANRFGYLLAGSIGVARVTGKEHFPSDVLVGGTLGVLLGRCALACPKN